MSAQNMSSIFEGKIRVRVMGLIIENNKLLMINHSGLSESNIFWAPPGGGINFGEGLKQGLKREINEELNIDAEVGEMLCGNEFIQGELHAMEFFFLIDNYRGKLKLGIDPELGQSQILKEFKFMTLNEIKKLDKRSCHELFLNITSFDDLTKRGVVFNLKNNS